MSINTIILSLAIALVTLPAVASPRLKVFPKQLLTEVHDLRVANQIALNIALKKRTGSHLPIKASLALLDNYLKYPQNKVLYDKVRTLLGASREKFDKLAAIRQLEYQAKRIASQQHQESETDEELTSQARQLFDQHQHLFDEPALQRLTTGTAEHEEPSAEAKLMRSLMEEDLAEIERDLELEGLLD